MKKTFIIAEAGVNHNGSLKLAKKLIDAAKEIGADAVKFQTFITEELAIPRAPKAEYQKKRVSQKNQFEMLKKLELSQAQFKKLFNYCGQKNIMFLSTPFDYKSAQFLDKLGMSYFKISSCDLTNTPFLSKIAEYGKPVILSTGMSNLSEVKTAFETISSRGNHKITLLHCTSNYPAKYKTVNLNAIITLKKEFGSSVGYSDHTSGIEVSIAAVALGATMIEKHLTLSNKLHGPDHQASIEPEMFASMVKAIRNIEQALGTGLKVTQHSEIAMRRITRKSIVALHDIPKGYLLNKDSITVKRPGHGIPPGEIEKLIGKKTKIYIKKNSIILWKHLNG